MAFLCVEDVLGMVFSYLQQEAEGGDKRLLCISTVGISVFIFTYMMCTIILKLLALLLIEYQVPFPDILNFKAWIFRGILIA
jgi:hypothetical protein